MVVRKTNKNSKYFIFLDDDKSYRLYFLLFSLYMCKYFFIIPLKFISIFYLFKKKYSVRPDETKINFILRFNCSIWRLIVVYKKKAK